MAKKVKEKPTKSTNIDLDNEIIIGIKTLPEIEPKKKNKKKTITKKNRTVKKPKGTKKDEFELKLGIEDEEPILSKLSAQYWYASIKIRN